ncbi:hypothetical protein [Arthrobacter sp. B3I4]|uniref:hypothetical protein n=1 Tax=Arthrobacter sp. B3I4 TaxID=3042267 RepID=UPI00278AF441|nr:hypothetical protein [Arthrobacter sp. B3I4]MDQ0756126.1 putative small secreted protein [Arthrobacter sp. B3I4]
MKRHLVVVTVVAGMALAGCGVTKDAEYKDISELGKAYEQAVGDGVKCSGTAPNIEKNGWTQDQCGPTGIVMMFTSDAKREEIKQKNPLKAGRRWVQGKNWLIAADQYQAEKAQSALGGQLLTS